MDFTINQLSQPMKISTLIYLVFAIFILSGCQKDDSEKSGQRLRITKMFNTLGYSYVFNYDSNGNLVTIQKEGGTIKTTNIEYNSKGQPIQINGSTYNGNVKIEWNTNGFNAKCNIGASYWDDNYILDSKGQVKSQHSINSNGQENIYNFNWIKSDSLIVDWGHGYRESYKLTKINSPLKGINIAIVLNMDIECDDIPEYQNLYCRSIYVKDDSQIHSNFQVKFDNEVNDQNYPKMSVGTGIGANDYGSSQTFYEYETY